MKNGRDDTETRRDEAADALFEEDFAQLDPDEAKTLDQMARALRDDRFEPDDEHFWDGLHQRIMNEVAVTKAPQGSDPQADDVPINRSRSASDDRSPLPWWRRVLSWVAGGQSVGKRMVWALAGAAAVMLAWLILQPPSEPPESAGTISWADDETSQSEGTAQTSPEPPQTLDQALAGGQSQPNQIPIPDELIGDGLFAQALTQDDLGALAADWESGQDDPLDAEWDEAEEAMDLLAGDYGAYDEGEYQYGSGDWGLGDLSTDELELLDEMLDAPL